MNVPASVTTTVESGLYVEVQRFYARQVHLLDSWQAEPFAATFAADGVFEHSPDAPAVQGRANIAEGMRAFYQSRYAQDPVQRRHWFNMLDVQEQADGSVHTQFYALVVTTRPGQAQPVIAPSCSVHDVLVREDGELRLLRRKVSQDHVAG